MNEDFDATLKIQYTAPAVYELSYEEFKVKRVEEREEKKRAKAAKMQKREQRKKELEEADKKKPAKGLPKKLK